MKIERYLISICIGIKLQTMRCEYLGSRAAIGLGVCVHSEGKWYERGFNEMELQFAYRIRSIHRVGWLPFLRA